jgi:hypothetical protein
MPMTNQRDLRTKHDVDGPAVATQLSILLSAATSTIDEEFRRSERLEAKSRNQATIVAGFFVGVQAVIASLINGVLQGVESGVPASHHASAAIPWLVGLGGLGAILLVVVVIASFRAWRLFQDPALSTDTITQYIDFAKDGNVAVGINLVKAYAEIANGRRQNNEVRAKALQRATLWCGTAVLAIGIELVVGLIAAAVE